MDFLTELMLMLNTKDEDKNCCDGSCENCNSSCCDVEDYVTDLPDLNYYLLKHCIENVYFNESKKTVTVKMTDGEAITVKCCENDNYDREVGLKTALLKYLTGNSGKFNSIVNYWLKNGSDSPSNKKVEKNDKSDSILKGKTTKEVTDILSDLCKETNRLYNLATRE